MQEFTGLQYLEIDIANCYGMDRLPWDCRFDWVKKNVDNLEYLDVDAKDKIRYRKAVKAYRSALEGDDIGHIVYLDATNSGLQISAVLSGCLDTAKAVNMIDPNVRWDAYELVADKMNAQLPIEEHVSRDDIKKPVMTFFYNKAIQDTLSNLQEKVFYPIINKEFPGAVNIKEVSTDRWDSTALYHMWTLPDGYVSKVPVTDMIDYTIELDELNHTKFNYRTEMIMPSERNTSLSPNINHSIDAYVVRYVVRKCKKLNIPIVTIHDAFGSHVNFLNEIRYFYMQAMADIAKSNLLLDILKELGYKGIINKYSNNLDKYIMNSEYMLS